MIQKVEGSRGWVDQREAELAGQAVRGQLRSRSPAVEGPVDAAVVLLVERLGFAGSGGELVDALAR